MLCGVARGFMAAGAIFSSAYLTIEGETAFTENTATFEGGETLFLAKDTLHPALCVVSSKNIFAVKGPIPAASHPIHVQHRWTSERRTA